MRRFTSLMSALLVVAAFSIVGNEADVTRTLRYELDPRDGFIVENLIGRMTVVPGRGGNIEVIATVHAESEGLARSMGLDLVRDGLETKQHLRVIYPVDEHRRYQSPEGWGSTTTRYAGRRVKVSRTGGVLLYADVEIRVPSGEIRGKFRNVVGAINGERIEGDVMFDTGSGDIMLTDVRGRITADTGSGDVEATEIEGFFNGDTGSGEIRLSQFRGTEIRCDTGSGGIRISDSDADSLNADTGSGDITVSHVSVREVSADTGSGDVTISGDGIESVVVDTGSGSVEIETPGRGLDRVSVDTGSGDLTVRMGPDASFEAIAEQGSGRIRNRYRDADPILEGREVVGYRLGAARTRIIYSTGSGTLTLQPD